MHQVPLAHTHKQSKPETSYLYPETFLSIPLPRKSKSRTSKVKLSRHLQTWKQLSKLAEVPSTKSLRLPYVPSFLPFTSFQIRLDLLKTTLLYISRCSWRTWTTSQPQTKSTPNSSANTNPPVPASRSPVSPLTSSSKSSVSLCWIKQGSLDFLLQKIKLKCIGTTWCCTHSDLINAYLIRFKC